MTLAYGKLFFTEEVYNFWYINHGEPDCDYRLSLLTHMPLTAVRQLTRLFKSQFPDRIVLDNHKAELKANAELAELAILNQRLENIKFAKSAKEGRYKGVRSAFSNK